MMHEARWREKKKRDGRSDMEDKKEEELSWKEKHGGRKKKKYR